MSLKANYSIVRYVPDLIRNEGVNIGIVVEVEHTANEKSIYLQFAESFQRAAKIDPFLKTTVLEKAVRGSVEQIILESEGHDLDSLVLNFSAGKVQLTEPRFALLDNVQLEMNRLFHQFVIDEKDERHHGITEPILKKEVRETLKRVGINGDRVSYGTTKKPVFLKGTRSKHLFDLSVQVNSHRDFIRCISFDVEHYVLKLDAAKVLVYDTKDIKETNTNAEVVSIMYPPKLYANRKAQELFSEARAILQDERIPSFNFDSSEERKKLLERIQQSGH
jgi:hypothetical protein